MGLIADLIGIEQDKKKQERQLQFEVWKNYLQSGQIKQGQETQAWEQLKKSAPKDSHGILDMFKPVLMAGARGAGKVGEALHLPGAEKLEEAGTPKYKAPGAANGRPKPGEEGSPFLSEEQVRERQLQQHKIEDARAVEKATKLAQAKQTMERQAEVQNRKEDAVEFQRITQDDTIPEAQKQFMIAELGGKAPAERNWKSGVVVLGNGSELPVSYNEKDPSKVMIGGGQTITLPLGSSPPMSWEDRERQKKEPKTPGEKFTGDLKTQIDTQEILSHPEKYDAATVQAAKREQVRLNTQQTGNTLRVQVEREQLPGAAGQIAPPTAGQAPIDRFNPQQKNLVSSTVNMLASGTSVGFGQAARNQINEGRRLIEQATGLTPEEVDFRVERRKAAKQSYDKLKLLEASTQGLFSSLDRSGVILTNLRPQLPNSDVTKINEWLQSGAREFNVTGVSDAAVRYGLALAAVRNEYARVIAGGAASVGQTPVEALRLAGEQMRPGFTIGNTKAMVDQIRQEGRQVIGGRQDELNNLSSEVRGQLFPELFGKPYQQPEITPPPPPANGRLGKELPGASGTVPYKSNGKIYNIPAGQVQEFLKDHPQAVKQ
jgi:hypothetical protein